MERSGPPGRRPHPARGSVSRRFQSERGVCKDADSSQETLSSVPPPARPQGHRKEEPVPGGLESHHQRGQEGSVAKFGVNCAILPCHGAASETDA